MLNFIQQNFQFFVQFENIKPDITTVKELFLKPPKGCLIEQKLILGVYNNNNLIGIIELIKNRHKNKEWLISLFIIDIRYRNKGFGRSVIHKLELNLTSRKVNCLILGVIEKNKPAMSFWKQMNYIQHSKEAKLQDVNGTLLAVHTFFKEI